MKMAADIGANEKLCPFVTELFLRGKKLSISLVFISQYYFKETKTTRLNATPHFIMKTPKKRTLTNSIESFI